jgi:hypothetical protein
MEDPRFTYTDDDIAVAAVALRDSQDVRAADFDDPGEWLTSKANAEGEVEAVLESIGGRHITAILVPDP